MSDNVTNPGVHLMLPRDAAKRLFANKGDDAAREFVREFRQDAENQTNGLVLETGSAWRVIHRCLTDGTLDRAAGEFPLNHTILGGRHLCQAGDFFAVLVRPDMVAHVADALAGIDRDSFHARFCDLPDEETADPFDAIWTQLQNIGSFFAAAGEQRAAVLFAADA